MLESTMEREGINCQILFENRPQSFVLICSKSAEESCRMQEMLNAAPCIYYRSSTRLYTSTWMLSTVGENSRMGKRLGYEWLQTKEKTTLKKIVLDEIFPCRQSLCTFFPHFTKNLRTVFGFELLIFRLWIRDQSRRTVEVYLPPRRS